MKISLTLSGESRTIITADVSDKQEVNEAVKNGDRYIELLSKELLYSDTLNCNTLFTDEVEVSVQGISYTISTDPIYIDNYNNVPGFDSKYIQIGDSGYYSTVFEFEADQFDIAKVRLLKTKDVLVGCEEQGISTEYIMYDGRLIRCTQAEYQCDGDGLNDSNKVVLLDR